jgi:hypothetical protein
MSPQENPADSLKAKLNRETSKISWRELQRFYAQGAVVLVEPGMDLIEVACLFSRDDAQAIKAWMESGKIARVDDGQAKQWYEQESTVWAVVVAPWVLVQPLAANSG